MKRILCTIAALALLLSGCARTPAPAAGTSATTTETAASGASEGVGAESTAAAGTADPTGVYELGDTVEDFTVTLADGQSVTLSELLKEKKVVVVNFWATWCAYCVQEFPDLQQVYADHAEDMALIALSVEKTDSDDIICDFQKEHGFEGIPMGQDTIGLHDRFPATGWPTTVIIDRNGVVCMSASGMIPSAKLMENVFSLYTGDDYTEQLLPDGVPDLPMYESAPAEELAAALKTKDFTLHCETDGDQYQPFLPAADGDGLTTSLYHGFSSAQLDGSFTAAAGDVVAFDLVMERGGSDADLTVYLDEEPILLYHNEPDGVATGFTVPTDGEHTISMMAECFMGGKPAGEIKLQNLRILTGAEAAAYPLPQPKFVHTLPGTEFRYLLPESAEPLEILVDGKPYTGMALEAYLVQDYKVDVTIELGEEINEQLLTWYVFHGGALADRPLTENMTPGSNGAVYTSDNSQTKGYLDIIGRYKGSSQQILALLHNEEEAAAYIEDMVTYKIRALPPEQQVEVLLRKQDGTVLYRYTPENAATATQPDLRCVDESGAPVAGATVQLCSGSLCMVAESDENGSVPFEGDAYPYTVHVLYAPDGYTADDTVYNLTASDQTLTLTLKKGK